jgi:tetratricopeptide (TPR) repeat protein
MPSGTCQRRRLFGLALVAALLFPAWQSAHAEDVVTLRTSAGTSRKLTGEILDYTGRGLRLRTGSGREQTIQPNLVERMETARSAEHVAGDQLLAAGDFRLAESKYRAALESNREPRAWVRRMILAQLVWCYQNSGQWDLAGETFLTIASQDPETIYLECIPLAWTTQQPSRSLETVAKTWLVAANNPFAQLLGASHLLASDDRRVATARLQTLSADRDPRLAWLAQAQLWRSDVSRATPADLARWSRTIDEQDESLRAGAYYVLGLASSARDPESAALALLELPILYKQHRRLASAALLAAGSCLERTGDETAAAALYRELVNEYEGAPEIGEARRRLETLTAKGKS